MNSALPSFPSIRFKVFQSRYHLQANQEPFLHTNFLKGREGKNADDSKKFNNSIVLSDTMHASLLIQRFSTYRP